LPIGYVTNGVHAATWIANPLGTFLDAQLGPNWLLQLDDATLWNKVLELDDAGLWKCTASSSPVMRQSASRRGAAGDTVEGSSAPGPVRTLLDQEALTIGFVRRFATYKRADLIFRDAAGCIACS